MVLWCAFSICPAVPRANVALVRRNIYRGTSRAFASDAKALQWAAHLQESGVARQMSVPARAFSIMPFMHSEEERDQQVGLMLALHAHPH